MLGRLVSALLGGDTGRRYRDSEACYARAVPQEERVIWLTPDISYIPPGAPGSSRSQAGTWLLTNRLAPISEHLRRPLRGAVGSARPDYGGTSYDQAGASDGNRHALETLQSGWRAGALGTDPTQGRDEREASLRLWQRRSHEWETEKLHLRQQLG